MNIFTPIAILLFGGPPLFVMWAVKKFTGRQISEGVAFALIFLAVILVVDIGVEVTA